MITNWLLTPDNQQIRRVGAIAHLRTGLVEKIAQFCARFLSVSVAKRGTSTRDAVKAFPKWEFQVLHGFSGKNILYVVEYMVFIVKNMYSWWKE